jgi:hypothetical protein
VQIASIISVPSLTVRKTLVEQHRLKKAKSLPPMKKMTFDTLTGLPHLLAPKSPVISWSLPCSKKYSHMCEL